MSETAALLAETTQRLLDRLDAASGALPQARAARLLAELRETGLAAALVRDDSGGGCSLAEAAAIARCWGARAAPLPIVEVLLAPVLADMAGGRIEGDRATVAAADTVRIRLDEGNVLHADGRVEAPALGDDRVVLTISATADGRAFLLALPADCACRFSDIAGEPWLRLDAAGLDGSHVLSNEIAPDRLAWVRRAGALLTCAAMVGAMESVVRMVVEQANVRSQFGRPIGKFQAVQNLIADAAGEIAVTAAAVDAALVEADRQDARDLDWLAAKAQAGRAATTVAAAAHQVFGAIGFTEEHDLHLYTKRLWHWRDEWGRQSDCEARIGRLAAAAGRTGLWDLIVGETA